MQNKDIIKVVADKEQPQIKTADDFTEAMFKQKKDLGEAVKVLRNRRTSQKITNKEILREMARVEKKIDTVDDKIMELNVLYTTDINKVVKSEIVDKIMGDPSAKMLVELMSTFITRRYMAGVPVDETRDALTSLLEVQTDELKIIIEQETSKNEQSNTEDTEQPKPSK